MPSRARVAAFIASVVGGDHVRAIADFYHENASMQENLQPPRRGRAALTAHEARDGSSTTQPRRGRWSKRPRNRAARAFCTVAV
jgi:hypothetical protein